jgi:hypothetical protein
VDNQLSGKAGTGARDSAPKQATENGNFMPAPKFVRLMNEKIRRNRDIFVVQPGLI